MPQKKFHRQNELKRIEEALQKKGPVFFYVRGRRRVGKSWLLKKIVEKHSNAFYFMGSPDTKTSGTQASFVNSWTEFTGDQGLAEIRKSALDWRRIFAEITKYSSDSKKDIILIFDEIQWIAKEGSGFIGRLKEAWLDWEGTEKIKVVICGSSNKFFSDKTGGEEKILRGLKTHSDVVIYPLSFSQCLKEKFKNWKREEAAIAYMMTGGVPYYLNQIDETRPFVHALNDAFFTKNSIFLEEAEEVLNVDFNKKGLRSVKQILSVITLQGSSEVNIAKKAKIAKSTVNEVLGKLEEYNIVQALQPHNQPSKENLAGAKYIIKDFYLNTYFSLLHSLQNKIRINTKDLLFTSACLKSDKGYYIHGYTGYMYEKMIRGILESKSMKEPLFGKLNLRDSDFSVTQYWDKEQQIDLIVEHNSDRISRALEIKWLAEYNTFPEQILKNLKDKHYPMSPYYTRENYVVTSELKKNTRSKRTSHFLTLADLS